MKAKIKRIALDRFEFELLRESGDIERGACCDCGIKRITENENIKVTWLN